MLCDAPHREVRPKISKCKDISLNKLYVSNNRSLSLRAIVLKKGTEIDNKF